MILPPQRAPYLFVDGANASKTVAEFVERYWPGERTELDWARVSPPFHKVFVYDALPVRKADEPEDGFALKLAMARDRLAAISRAPDTHVRTGLTRAEGLRGQLRQKGVDIQLAVDALSMAHRGALSEAVIWTSDLDFLPLFEELVLMGVKVTLWYPPNITTDVLCSAADRANPVQPSQLYGFLPPQFSVAHRLPFAQRTPAPYWGGVVVAQWEVGETPSGYAVFNDQDRYVVWKEIEGPLALEIHDRSIDRILKLAEDQFGLSIPDAARVQIEGADPNVEPNR
jgi:uncharacterized LabA/DUF88 family protein